MKNKKIFIAGAGATILILGIVLGVYFIGKNDIKDKSKETVNKYFELISKKEYKGLYELLSDESKKSITEEEFIKRNSNIYEGIEAKDIKVETKEIDSQGGEIVINTYTTMETQGGKVEFDNTFKLENESYKVKWDSTLIFPELENDYKVKVSTSKSKRGDILDRNDKKLATDSYIGEIGIVPEKITTSVDNVISQVSSVLNIPADFVSSKVNADYVKPYMLVPIKKLSLKDERIGILKQIGGVVVTERDGRVYPLGEKSAHLTGYVQSVSKEDLDKDEEGVYTINSVIGKSGLESIYEKRIRGIDGCKVYIVDKNNKEVKVVSEREVKNGENIKLTIDSDLQVKAFDGLKGEKGSNVTMNPNTGEVLTLVSSPAYDPNDFVLGVSNEKWEELNSSALKPLFNRFQSNISPGSAFKPITAAIALETKKLNPNDDKKITGLNWQKDNSWGGYKITRVKEYGGASNLSNAMAYSDNIYFAMAALDVGAKDFHDMLAKLGMGEGVPFDFPMSKSVISSEEALKKEVLLGDSGYGQGEILMNPLHLGVLYTMFANNGDVLTPVIEFGAEKKVWKSSVISKENANIVGESIRGVVNIPGATGNGLNIPGRSVFGKTGTAEIKQSQDDKTGTEIGWTVGMTEGGNNNRLVVTFIEDVKDKGGSGYVVPKVREMLVD